jgi:hypothetical protein
MGGRGSNAEARVDLQERLADYHVTLVPGRERLRLLWSVASELVVEEEMDEPAVEASATISILDAYRITRVPARAAS